MLAESLVESAELKRNGLPKVNYQDSERRSTRNRRGRSSALRSSSFLYLRKN